MPIQFRCTTCNQLLSISRKKAGVEILCPKCTTLTRVPQIAEADDAEAAAKKPAGELPAASKPAGERPAASKAPAPPPEAPPKPAPPTKPAPSERPAVQAPAAAAPPVEPPSAPPAPEPPIEERVLDDLDRVDELVNSEVENDVSTFLHASHGGLTSPVPSLPYNPWTDIDHDEDDFHPTKRQAPPKDELDMTSLVDVTFLLLVFFMITASFTVQKFLQIAAPESDDNAAAATAVVSNDDIVGDSVVVAVDAEDRIVVDDKPVGGLAELKELFIQKRRDENKTDVLIEAAYQATHGTVVAVTDMAMQAEMRHVRRASRRDADE